MYSPTDIKNAMDAAIAARRSSDYSTAITEAEVALGMLGAVADQEKGGFAGAKLNWDRNAIKEFIDSLRRSQRAKTSSGKGGMQTVKLKYKSHSCTDLEEID